MKIITIILIIKKPTNDLVGYAISLAFLLKASTVIKKTS